MFSFLRRLYWHFFVPTSQLIDDRVTILDEHDAIKACLGYDPAVYEDIKGRQYTVVTKDPHGGLSMGFGFHVDESGAVTFVSTPMPILDGVDII